MSKEDDRQGSFISFIRDDQIQDRLAQDMIARTEDRIRRTRAERSLKKQQINQSSMLDLIHSSFINGMTQDRES